jgi:hypothetical protein
VAYLDLSAGDLILTLCFSHFCRLVAIWEDRAVFGSAFCKKLRETLNIPVVDSSGKNKVFLFYLYLFSLVDKIYSVRVPVSINLMN